MSRGFSAAQIKGTLGRDPESRSTPNGTKVVNFSVAVERGYGEKTCTDWRNVVAWGPLAEFAEKYLKKGKSVYVCGELQDRSWEDKTTGQKRTVTEIRADRIEFADTEKSSSGESKPIRQERATPQPRQQATNPTRSTEAESNWNDSEDIPF